MGSTPGSGRSPGGRQKMTTHSIILAWKTPWTEEAGGLQSKASQRAGHDWVTEHISTHLPPKTCGCSSKRSWLAQTSRHKWRTILRVSQLFRNHSCAWVSTKQVISKYIYLLPGVSKSRTKSLKLLCKDIFCYLLGLLIRGYVASWSGPFKTMF